jgi:hypothetical protein
MFAFVAQGISGVEQMAREVAIDDEIIQRQKLVFEENLGSLDAAAKQVAKL